MRSVPRDLGHPGEPSERVGDETLIAIGARRSNGDATSATTKHCISRCGVVPACLPKAGYYAYIGTLEVREAGDWPWHMAGRDSGPCLADGIRLHEAVDRQRWARGRMDGHHPPVCMSRPFACGKVVTLGIGTLHSKVSPSRQAGLARLGWRARWEVSIRG